MDEQTLLLKNLTEAFKTFQSAQSPSEHLQSSETHGMQTSKKLQYIDRIIFGIVIIAAVIACFINADIADKLFDLAKFVAGAIGIGTIGYMYNSAVEKKADKQMEADKYEADMAAQKAQIEANATNRNSVYGDGDL